MKNIKFNLKRFILLLILGFFAFNLCLCAPKHRSPQNKEKSPRNGFKKPISRKKKNLSNLLLLRELEKVSEKELFDASKENIKLFITEQVCDILDKSKKEINDLLEFNNISFLAQNTDNFIKKAKEVFCNKDLLNELLNCGKIYLNKKIPTYINYLKLDESDYYGEVCEEVDQTIFDEIFLKKIIIGVFPQFTQIIELDLSNNYLIEIPTNIKNLQQLEKLDLSDNQITEDKIEQANGLLKQMPNLSLLNLSNIDYENDEFPNTIGHLTKNAKKTEDIIYLNKNEITKEKIISDLNIKKYIIYSAILNLIQKNIKPIFHENNPLRFVQPCLNEKDIISNLINTVIYNIENSNWLDLVFDGSISLGINKIIPKNFIKNVYQNIASDFYSLNKQQIDLVDKKITKDLKEIIEEILFKTLEDGGFDE